MEEQQIERVREILSSRQDGNEDGKSRLIPILLEVQDSLGYLPEIAVRLVGELLNVSVGQIYSIASFYAQFRLKPIGRHRVTVCRGTACHIRGAPQILEEIENTINIKEGETSEDMEYTLETVACIGCCALAPCFKVNGEVHGEMTSKRTCEVFLDLEEGEPDAG